MNVKLSALVVAALAAAALAGCGGEDGERAARPAPQQEGSAHPQPSPPPPPPAPVAPPAESTPLPPPLPPPPPVEAPPPADEPCSHGTVHAVGDDTVSFAGVARRPFAARGQPDGAALAWFDTTNANGHATVVQIRGVVKDDCGMLWYYAALPMRPNGVAGFVAARDVRVHKVRTRIVVDLSQRKLTFYRDGEAELTATTAIGAPQWPTPTGRYYVNQRLIPSDPSGPYGPGAIGISAFSDVLQGWTQGGPIAIHGTNAPQLIGQAVSHGCIRVRNDVLVRLFRAVPAGAPVVIRA
jgi:lipoprotein-anchoring transpeptidase ErfK/SrfK